MCADSAGSHRRLAPAVHGAAEAGRRPGQALQQAGHGLEHRAGQAHVRAQRGARRAALVPAGQRLAHHACPGRAAAQSLAQSTATASGSMRAAKDSGGSRGG